MSKEKLKGLSLTSCWIDEAAKAPEGKPWLTEKAIEEMMSKLTKLPKDKYMVAPNNFLTYSKLQNPTAWESTGVHWSDVYKSGKQMKENVPQLGHEAHGKEPRDAVHMAVVVCKTGQWLQPGVKVVVRDGVAYEAKDGNHVGVTDPFMAGGVPKGKFVWVMLNPGSITSLRHEWTHPAFPVEAAKPDPKSSTAANKAAFDRLSKIAKKVGKDGNWLMGRLDAYAAEGYAYVGGDDATETLNRYQDEIWGAWERITGKRRPGDAYFSCSC